ncbi:hypothetical protein SLEP1_g39942 [Rubroshorea leprosula]|uniref:Pentatricopeptide repeat-containing protein n=1 Tax=Rubroshorea leprosula TaxID=152421 RepID=A0AAV5L1W9_9ROSI|nr:hypothetical protein SLEP1_g39942 [Rubroshorea leprosula]
MHDKMFEVFADMEELGVKPGVSIVKMVGNVFQKLGMMDKGVGKDREPVEYSDELNEGTEASPDEADAKAITSP